MGHRRMNKRIDELKYKKLLISLFVNKIYVYEDELTMIFNVGDKSITITKSLLKDINANLKNGDSSYIEQASPPRRVFVELSVMLDII